MNEAQRRPWSDPPEPAPEDARGRPESGIFPTDDAFVFDDGDDDDEIVIGDITIDERTVVEKVDAGLVDPIAALAAAIIDAAGASVRVDDLLSLMQIGSAPRVGFPASACRGLVDAGLVIDAGSALLAAPAFAEPALAWRRILREEADDAFDAIGPLLLDEWAATIASALAGDSSVEARRRELRRRGVAAFGLRRA